jgi:hypothetical protein
MGERKVKSKERVPLATECAALYAEYKQRVNDMSKCDSGHEVERSSKSQSPIAKDMRRKAKGSSNKSRIKKEKQNI